MKSAREIIDAPIRQREAGGELLLELLSEEIPARMQRRAIDDLVRLVRDKLAAAELPPPAIRGYVTPRRLAVIADGIPAHQPQRREERRGPRVGAPAQAIEGFLRSAGLSAIEQCEVRDAAGGRGEFYFAVIERPGRPAAEVMPELLYAAIAELPWPKSMRFPAASLRWVRPLVSVICLFDGEVLPLPLGDVPVGRITRGHRFLSEGEIAVASAADYVEKLDAAYVILDHDRRRDLIAVAIDRRAAAEALTVKPDLDLINQVTGLVEYPVVLMGRIEEEFVRPVPEGLPPEVLATAMRTHQKYFSCLKAEPAPAEAGGTPAPYFVFVANNLTPDDGKTIIAGNERVLRARLADARFFWEQDHKVRLEERVDALKQRVYYDKLGTMYDKAERIERLAGFLAEQLCPDDATLGRLARRAARLAKADLSTGMVGEFPELQGVMGRYYALHDGEDPRVADAIADHYKPLGPNDTCPTAPVSIVVALADKIDALAAFFAIGEKPTGSRDPFALRRAAVGIIRLVLEHKPWPLRLRLLSAFSRARKPLDLPLPDSSAELLEFVIERLKIHLRDQGFRHDLIAACFRPAGKADDDIARIVARVEALRTFLEADYGTNLLIAYRRASHIVGIEETRDHRSYDGDLELSLLRQPEERSLLEYLEDLTEQTSSAPTDVFEPVFQRLTRLRGPVDEFFSKVIVNTEDRALRENRLRLLSRIRAVMNQVADFSQIEG